jgi:hypothetical protein
MRTGCALKVAAMGKVKVVEVIRVYAVEALSLGLKRREREGNHLSP